MEEGKKKNKNKTKTTYVVKNDWIRVLQIAVTFNMKKKTRRLISFLVLIRQNEQLMH